MPVENGPGRSEVPVITVVSGLPRSGTSLMMRILQEAGLPPLTDWVRPADGDNPYGYFEHQGARQLPQGHVDWLEQAPGMAVKVVAPLLHFLPEHYRYRIVLMRRNMEEILASQRIMLQHRQQPDGPLSDAEMAELYDATIKQVVQWVEGQPHLTMAQINYNELVTDAHQALAPLETVLGPGLDRQGLAQLVDPDLYRQRRGTCLDGDESQPHRDQPAARRRTT